MKHIARTHIELTFYINLFTSVPFRYWVCQCECVYSVRISIPICAIPNGPFEASWFFCCVTSDLSCNRIFYFLYKFRGLLTKISLPCKFHCQNGQPMKKFDLRMEVNFCVFFSWNPSITTAYGAPVIFESRMYFSSGFPFHSSIFHFSAINSFGRFILTPVCFISKIYFYSVFDFRSLFLFQFIHSNAKSKENKMK